MWCGAVGAGAGPPRPVGGLEAVGPAVGSVVGRRGEAGLVGAGLCAVGLCAAGLLGVGLVGVGLVGVGLVAVRLTTAVTADPPSGPAAGERLGAGETKA